jgi:type IV secretion/conjugal transfer VirB4 family ATPase
MIFPEHSSRAEGLPDLLAWFTLVAPGVVLNKDGSLLAGWAYSGPDLDSSTAEELGSQAEILNRALLALGDGWGLHADALRLHAPAYPREGAFPDPVTRLLDEERRSLYEARPLFETRLYLTVTYAPPPRGSSRLKGFFFDGLTKEEAQRIETALDSPLAYFEGRLGELEDHLGGALRLARLDDRSLLTLLHTCLTGLTHTVEVPPVPDLLDYYLGSQDLYGGLAPRIGGQAVKILSFALLPLATSPGLLDQLARLPIPFRFSTRFLPLDPSTALRVLSSYRLRWMQSRRGLRYFSDLSSPEARRAPEAAQDHDSLNMLRDIDDVRAEVASGTVRLGFYSAVLVLHDESPDRLAGHARNLARQVRNLNIPVREEEINALDTFFGSLPGHLRPNLRRPLVTTRNLAHLLPVTSVWPGRAENPSRFTPPGGYPALLWTETEGATPFRLNLHADDVGHTLVVGPTGSGKSAMVSYLMASWFRYPGAKVVAFDKGLSYLALTLATGGAHYPIAGDSGSIAFCPLSGVDDPMERSWAVEWLETLYHLTGLDLTPGLRRTLAEALDLVAGTGTGQGGAQRTLTNLWFKLQDPSLRTALLPYTVQSGAVGGALLDAEEDRLSEAPFLCFEMSHLMELGPKYVIPTLLYLFHRIYQRLDGSPTLLVLDEAWTYLRDPLFAGQLRQWLKELRKANASVLFATQSLADLAESSLREVLYESCPTKLYLPNPQATNESTAPLYRALGLNSRQLQIIGSAAPKADYYVTAPEGNRLFRLQLPPVALALCGAGSKEELAAIRHLAREHGPHWSASWLEARNLPAWAARLRAAYERNLP